MSSWPSGSDCRRHRAFAECGAWRNAGVITGYRACIDPAESGRGFEVLVSVEIDMTDRRTLERFESAVAALDEVVELRRMFGRPDYLLRVAVADSEEYQRWHMDNLVGLHNVRRVTSHQTMKLIKAAM